MFRKVNINGSANICPHSPVNHLVSQSSNSQTIIAKFLLKTLCDTNNFITLEETWDQEGHTLDLHQTYWGTQPGRELGSAWLQIPSVTFLPVVFSPVSGASELRLSPSRSGIASAVTWWWVSH